MLFLYLLLILVYLYMYKPKIWLIVLDIIEWLIMIALLILWRKLADKSATMTYLYFFLELCGIWIASSFFTFRYRTIKKASLLRSLAFWAINMVAFTLVSFVLLPRYVAFNPSITLINTVVISLGVLSLIDVLWITAYRYAINMDQEGEEETLHFRREPHPCESVSTDISDEKKLQLKQSIVRYTNNSAVIDFLEKNVPNLYTTCSKIIVATDIFHIDKILPYRYSTLINLAFLNNVRGINHQMRLMNEKLPDDGLFVSCFMPQSVMKEMIFDKYPPVINYIVYIFYFIFRRVLSKMFWTNRLYFDLTGGKHRALSRTEILGRYYYNGFEVLKEDWVGHAYYVVGRRIKDPVSTESKRYGPLMTLKRVGYHKKLFEVYKLRTMHAYSEYLQPYIYEHNKLQEGGKIKDDFRISTLGAFFRKYWLDELPMFINFFKGEMKFVGVRPLSQHYLSLYSKELVDLRTKVKPGLFPPFYADMPKTLEDIEASEMKYLKACMKNGVFVTDCRYFWRIVVSIVWRKARSH